MVNVCLFISVNTHWMKIHSNIASSKVGPSVTVGYCNTIGFRMKNQKNKVLIRIEKIFTVKTVYVCFVVKNIIKHNQIIYKQYTRSIELLNNYSLQVVIYLKQINPQLF